MGVCKRKSLIYVPVPGCARNVPPPPWTPGNPLERQLYLGDGVGVVPFKQTQCGQITCSHTMIRQACMVSSWLPASLTPGSTLQDQGSQESKTG